MSLSEEITRRDFLKYSIGITVLSLLSCTEKRISTEKWPKIEVPSSQTIRIDIKGAATNSKLKGTEMYVYSNPNEPWNWFTIGFDSDPRKTPADFSLLPVNPDLSLNTKERLTQIPIFKTQIEKEIYERSISRAIGDLTFRFKEESELSEIFKNKSMTVRVKKPEKDAPYVPVYESRGKDFREIIPIKLIFPSPKGILA